MFSNSVPKAPVVAPTITPVAVVVTTLIVLDYAHIVCPMWAPAPDVIPPVSPEITAEVNTPSLNLFPSTLLLII